MFLGRVHGADSQQRNAAVNPEIRLPTPIIAWGTAAGPECPAAEPPRWQMNRPVSRSGDFPASVDFCDSCGHTPAMSTALPPKPRIIGPKVRICIVASKYNEQFTDALVENAIEELGELVPQGRVDLIRVPGAFEIPVMVASILDRDPPACVIALGLIIRGSTDHADLVGRSVTDALQRLAIDSLRPVIHEVLLVDDEKQAYARCIGSQLNRGREAARAAAAMIDIFQELDRSMPRNTSAKKQRHA
jgi:6,7-dimethyl-8-ribityllumazine synthase